MAANYNQEYKAIGENFCQAFYNIFDVTETRPNIHAFYHLNCFLSFEGDARVGKDAAVDKIKNLPFRTIQHIITTCDTQPLADGSVLVMVLGQLKCDDDKPLPFSDTFILKPEAGSFFVTHEIFRLSMHNM